MLFALSDDLAFRIIELIVGSLMVLLLAWIKKGQGEAAKEAAEVKHTLKTATATTNQALSNVVEKVEEVHKATNSLTDRLVETTRTDAFAAGEKSERDKK